VLKAMRRRYDVATYARRIERARAQVPRLNLTGDVIVGFPAEDGAAFARTLATVEELAFSRLHVFPYSPRPNTRTADADPVPAAVKRRRAERLRALSDRLGQAHRAARVGQLDHVLIERVDTAGRLHGYGADYTAYELRAPAGAGVGDLVEVVLEAPGARVALGRLA
jgi:threonylcarbamoyladenosine tRNA methylthiotransferase MtaB